MIVTAVAALSKSEKLTPISYTLPPLGPFDVRIQITHCGICHSDIHLLDNDWSMTHYPFVPGHEIIGIVSMIGKQCSNIKPGDRVGVGWQRSACFSCEHCKQGNEHFCAKSQATCVDHHGGYASAIQIDHRFVFPLPENLSSEKAAPLLCGGITVYSPLVSFNIQPGMKVGVLGVGGLGHLAIQFAAKMGFKVVAFSSSQNKKADAIRLGADDFVLISNVTQLKQYNESIDFLLSTVNADLDWSNFMDLVRPKGKFCFVGAPKKRLSIPIYKLLHGQRSICGSPIGSPSMVRNMLQFSAKHDIQATTQLVSLNHVNKAIQKIRKNKARYRMVIKVQA